MHRHFTINDLENLEHVITTFYKDLVSYYQKNPPEKAVIIALSGDLGAGKTTTTQILARLLGISETVQSPTFVIKKVYTTTHPLFKKLIHIDAYRLAGDPSLAVLRLNEDFLDPAACIAVEWPEMITDLLPENRIIFTFSHTQTGRELTITTPW